MGIIATTLAIFATLGAGAVLTWSLERLFLRPGREPGPANAAPRASETTYQRFAARSWEWRRARTPLRVDSGASVIEEASEPL
jgi:hypothetical protein